MRDGDFVAGNNRHQDTKTQSRLLRDTKTNKSKYLNLTALPDRPNVRIRDYPDNWKEDR